MGNFSTRLGGRESGKTKLFPQKQEQSSADHWPSHVRDLRAASQSSLPIVWPPRPFSPPPRPLQSAPPQNPPQLHHHSRTLPPFRFLSSPTAVWPRRLRLSMIFRRSERRSSGCGPTAPSTPSTRQPGARNPRKIPSSSPPSQATGENIVRTNTIQEEEQGEQEKKK